MKTDEELYKEYFKLRKKELKTEKEYLRMKHFQFLLNSQYGGLTNPNSLITKPSKNLKKENK